MSYQAHRLALGIALLVSAFVASTASAQDAGTAQSPTDAACADACRDEGACRFSGGQCIATSSADCREAVICMTQGRCTAIAGACVLASNDDCSRTMACRSDGFCTYANGRCAPGSSADCQRGSSCQDEGACTFVEGACALTGSADCARSRLCTENGRCSLVNGECVAANDADCQRGTRCTNGGQCTAVEGTCTIASRADCTRAGLCTSLGRCEPATYERNLECAATTDAMCRRSEACTRFGHCKAEEGRCVPSSDAMCRRARSCREEGNCTRLEASGVAYCGPSSAASCARATSCRGGRCNYAQSLQIVPGGMTTDELGWSCNALPPAPPGETALQAAMTRAGAQMLGAFGRPPALARLFELRRDPRQVFGVLGSLQGGTIGESFGTGGLGLRGTGAGGGGGTGVGTIGLGRLGTIGRGGTGSGSGYGRGLGGLAARSAAGPVIRTGSVEATGVLGSEVSRRVVRRHINDIRFCVDEAGPVQAQSVVLRFVVERNGSVSQAHITGAARPALRTCIERAARRWMFPSGSGETRVRVPLVVTPANP